MSALLQHYDHAGSASPDWIRACREIEQACDFEPLAAADSEPLPAISTPDLRNAHEVMRQALDDTMASPERAARKQALDDIAAELARREPTDALFEDDHLSELADDWRAERREQERADWDAPR